MLSLSLASFNCIEGTAAAVTAAGRSAAASRGVPHRPYQRTLVEGKYDVLPVKEIPPYIIRPRHGKTSSMLS